MGGRGGRFEGLVDRGRGRRKEGWTERRKGGRDREMDGRMDGKRKGWKKGGREGMMHGGKKKLTDRHLGFTSLRSVSTIQRTDSVVRKTHRRKKKVVKTIHR